MTTRSFILLALIAAPLASRAAILAEADIQSAAESFISADDVGSRLLKGRSVKSIEQRGSLWVVRLSPSGYVVFSGDTSAEPIVAFSTNDYSEPSDDSPFASLLALANTNATSAASAASAATPTVSPLKAAATATAATATAASPSATSRRAAKWNALLPKKTTIRSALSSALAPKTASLASVGSSSSLTQVAPLLTTKWNQVQPYNDFAPINPAASDSNSYRKRFPCGCVATAYAQILNYWQWPARVADVLTCDHSVSDADNNETSFRVRFDGRAPFDWTTMRESYSGGSMYLGWDLRGRVDEALRFPVARLVMFSAVLAKMSYAPGGSGAILQTAAKANPWFVQTNQVVRSTLGDDDTFFGLIRDDLASGYPVGVTVPGHQIVAHGWAEGDDATRYVYLNYGWGGSNDGYFNISETDAETTSKGYIDSALLGHVPLKTVQLDPLPLVSGTSVTLNWKAPAILCDSFAGYSVRVSKRGDAVSTWTQDFDSCATATDAAKGVFVGTASAVGNATPLLRVKPLAADTFALMSERTLTARSLLTYRVRSECALGLDVRIQGRFDGGDWQDLDVPPLVEVNNLATYGWEIRRVFLGDRAGQSLRLRVLVTNDRRYVYGSYAKYGVQLDDFALTDVLAFEEQAVSCAATARSFELNDLAPGGIYVFSVTPNADGALESESVQTRIAGVARSPLPGEETLTPVDFAYAVGGADWTLTTNDANKPTTTGGTSVTLGAFNGTLALAREMTATESGIVSFAWTAKGSYTSAPDVLSVTFTRTDGSVETLWAVTNGANQQTPQQVRVSLAPVAGERGVLAIVFAHNGSNYSYAGMGATISDVSVTGLAEASVPDEVTWGEETLAEKPLPQILSVSSRSSRSPVAVKEGFYRECARGMNVLVVTCSENVTSLEARPSHLSLVPDEAVKVYPHGRGKFVVTVDGSGVGDDAERSRMILTLVASAGTGPAAYKDLVLRVSGETPSESYPQGLVILVR